MIDKLSNLSDRLLAKLLPTTTAAALCWNEYCCQGQFYRTCCTHTLPPGYVCTPFKKS